MVPIKDFFHLLTLHANTNQQNVWSKNDCDIYKQGLAYYGRSYLDDKLKNLKMFCAQYHYPIIPRKNPSATPGNGKLYQQKLAAHLLARGHLPTVSPSSCESMVKKFVVNAKRCGHYQLIRHLLYDKIGARFFSAGEDGLIKVWEARSLNLIQTLRSHGQSITLLRLHPSNRFLLSCDGPYLKIWSLSTYALIGQIFLKDLAPITTLLDIDWIASPHIGSIIVIYEQCLYIFSIKQKILKKSNANASAKTSPSNVELNILLDNSCDLEKIVFDEPKRFAFLYTCVDAQLSPNGTRLLTSSKSGKIVIYSLNPRKLIFEINSNFDSRASVTLVDWSPSSASDFVVCYTNAAVKRFKYKDEINGWREVDFFRLTSPVGDPLPYTKQILDLVWSFDQKFLLVSVAQIIDGIITPHRGVYLYNVEKRYVCGEITLTSPIYKISFYTVERWYCIVLTDAVGNISFWNVETLKQITNIKVGEDGMIEFAFRVDNYRELGFLTADAVGNFYHVGLSTSMNKSVVQQFLYADDAPISVTREGDILHADTQKPIVELSRTLVGNHWRAAPISAPHYESSLYQIEEWLKTLSESARQEDLRFRVLHENDAILIPKNLEWPRVQASQIINEEIIHLAFDNLQKSNRSAFEVDLADTLPHQPVTLPKKISYTSVNLNRLSTRDSPIFVPQVGDEIVLVKQGYETFLKSNRLVDKLTMENLPDLAYAVIEKVTITDTDASCIKMMVTIRILPQSFKSLFKNNSTLMEPAYARRFEHELKESTFIIQYWIQDNTPEFIVLRVVFSKIFDSAKTITKKFWRRHQSVYANFVTLTEDQLIQTKQYFGTLIAIDKRALWESVKIRWMSDGSESSLNLWEVRFIEHEMEEEINVELQAKLDQLILWIDTNEGRQYMDQKENSTLLQARLVQRWYRNLTSLNADWKL